ncbi:transcriptional regulator [Lentzea sp. NBRC 105346]|uniref:helix-turn-helix domain-containing protein n=1 Tax=Lentzea sp. NBRC 105346 TaxID=3032205 RepID=UPI0024A191CF|nr:XRE family transcriptional regulator [Lentzea sp. NBRC 105346]GLZ32439.1 transcriptional regulator [Lentzea sp. NBRC 105346]
MLTPSRLTLARQRRGLTTADLSRRTGLAPSTITAYERGTRQPTPPTIENLSAALGFPQGFLTAPEPPDPSAVPRGAATAAQLAIEFSAWLDERFTLPAPDVPTHEHPDPETAAEMVRARWNLGAHPAPNMVQLLESRGARVFSTPANCAGAFSFWHRGTPFVFLDPATPPHRARFDAACGLGHLVGQSARPFAAAFLMPRKGITATSVTAHVREHARHWHVDPLALTYRLRDAELLTHDQYRELCARLATEPATGRRETSSLLPRVFRALREQQITPHHVARELLLDVEELNGLVRGLTLTPAARG